MPLVNDAPLFAQQPDPEDLDDFGVDVRDLLELDAGEGIDPTSIVVTVSAEAAALGVGIATGGGRSPTIADDGRTIVFWPQVDPQHHADAAFDGFGIEVDVAILFETTFVPPSRYKRTVRLQVRAR